MCLKVDNSEKYRYQPLVHYKYGTELFVITCQLLLVIFCLAVLPSCSNLAGPPYERPDVPIKKAWSEKTDVTVSADEVIRPDWWTNFQDPYLNGLVKQAIDKNIDLRILAARIEVARAAFQQEEAGLLPTLGVSPQASLARAGEVDSVSTTTQFSLTGQLNWEIDVWGKLKKGVQAQQAEYKATAADWRAGYLTLISDVASTYFLIRQLDEQIDQQQQALSKNQQILAIFEAQYREGLVAKTTVLQQKAEVSSLQGQLVELRRQRKLAENRLATLMGIPAGELQVPVADLRVTVKLVEIPAGLPSDLLSRRPDIIAAEYRVLQAHELTGEARLARLPSFSLTGTGSAGSLVSTALSGLLKTWSFGLAPSINIPIFDPSLKANVKVREAQTRVAEEEYRQTVIKAFEEVENVLVNLSHRKEQKKDLEQQLENLRIANEQIRAQLREGLVSQLEVFESERTLLTTELELLQIHQQILTDTVTLYKALGGGWPKENLALSDQ